MKAIRFVFNEALMSLLLQLEAHNFAKYHSGSCCVVFQVPVNRLENAIEKDEERLART